MKKVPLYLLNSLITVSKSTTLSEAASELGITQPGLTKQLSLLESLLPYKLFILEGKRKKLTPFGEELVLQIKSKMQGLDEIVLQTCERFSKPEDSTVRVIGRIGVLVRILPRLKFPGRLVFIDASNESTIKAVLNQTADIGITYFEHDSSEIISRPLYKEKFQLVIPKKLLSRKPTNLKHAFEQIKKFDCLTYKDPDEVFDIVLKHFDLTASDLKIKRTMANFECLIAMANQGMGWTIAPQQFPLDSKKHWILEIPQSLHPTRQFYLYYRKEIATTSWLKPLRQEIEECFKMNALN